MTQLGYDTIGGQSFGGVGLTTYTEYTATGSFTASTISIYTRGDPGATVGTFGIYADNAGAPGTLLGHTNEVAIGTSPSWVTATLLSGVAITNGAAYWICFAKAAACYAFFDAAACISDFSSDAYSSGNVPASNPAVTGWQTTDKMSMYASPATSGLTVAGPAAAATLPSNHAGNITLALTGTGTTWTGGGTTFTLPSPPAGWAKVSQNVTSNTAATVVVSCPSAATPPAGATGTLSVSDGTNTGTIAVATPTLAISPTSGATGTTPSLTLTGTHTLWQSETAAGLFTESGGTGASIGTPTVTGNGAATATLTVGSAAGTLTTTDASTGAAASFTATAGPVTILVADADVQWSPYNWFSDGGGAMQSNNVHASSTYAQTTCAGAYVKLGFTGTTLAVNLDLSPLSGAMPYLAYSIDGGIDTAIQITGTPAINLTGLASGNHTLIVFVQNVPTTNRWSSPQAIRITSFTLDSGATSIAPSGAISIRPHNLLIYHDSIGEGYRADGTGSSTCMPVYARWLAAALNAELGIVAYGSQGYTATGAGGVVPVFTPGNPSQTSWDKHDASHSRLVSGSLSPSPDYIYSLHGTNGGDPTTAVEGWLPAIRSAALSARIFLTIPFGGFFRTQLANAFTSYQGTPDSKCNLLDCGTEFQIGLDNISVSERSSDGLHPNPYGHAEGASRLTQLTQAIIGGGGGLLLNPGMSGRIAG